MSSINANLLCKFVVFDDVFLPFTHFVGKVWPCCAYRNRCTALPLDCFITSTAIWRKYYQRITYKRSALCKFGNSNKRKNVELMDWICVRSVYNREEISELLLANCNDVISASRTHILHYATGVARPIRTSSFTSYWRALLICGVAGWKTK